MRVPLLYGQAERESAGAHDFLGAKHGVPPSAHSGRLSKKKNFPICPTRADIYRMVQPPHNLRGLSRGSLTCRPERILRLFFFYTCIIITSLNAITINNGLLMIMIISERGSTHSYCVPYLVFFLPVFGAVRIHHTVRLRCYNNTRRYARFVVYVSKKKKKN